jgi:2-keto-4-pentenoate hydratase/2-oxohepta-3-ene-1,7-dioic acid hydratase in catechol pathway
VRVLTFTRDSDQRAGLLIGSAVYDIETCASFFGMPRLPSTVLALLESGAGGLVADLDSKIKAATASGTALPLGCWADLGETQVLAPIPRPPKILCLGLNYRDHAEEQDAKLPEVPLIFGKATSAVIATGQPIVIPEGSTRVDFEGELAFVVGKRLKHTPAQEAAEGIFGYTIMNDVSERDIQRERVWLRAKGIDTFAPMGPWIVTGDELGDPLALELTTKVNGRVMQSGSTANLIFKPAEIIAFITRFMTLEPGDVIATGTPSGVGVFRKPPVFLKQGDLVEITIQGIGTLTNGVRPANPQP